ncbi:MAG: hypothetical protein H0W15_09725 [Gemmatimonadales bacterium]|nr:hypothetical protein [Gemmatimonadales bacterium]
MSPSRDTTPAAERLRLAAIRAMPPEVRLREALRLSEMVRSLTLTGLRPLHPNLSELRLVEIVLGKRLIPPDPGATPP